MIPVNRKQLLRAAFAGGMMVSMASSINVQAQSADALLNKLVEKGILSKQEADELRKEADKGFAKGYQVKSGLPDWVTTLRIGGDFRGRYDMIHSDNETVRFGRISRWLLFRVR